MPPKKFKIGLLRTVVIYVLNLGYLAFLSFNPTKRKLLLGKFRRVYLAYFKRHWLEQYYLSRRRGSCDMTGACCHLGWGCPEYDNEKKICKIHEYKPMVCKLFPLTPEDIEDRNCACTKQKCGYYFVDVEPPKSQKA